jgi:hypothetical protein
MRQVEGVVDATDRRHPRLRQRVAIEPERRRQSVPVDDGPRGAVVAEPDVGILGAVGVEARTARLVEDAEDCRRSSLDLDDP